MENPLQQALNFIESGELSAAEHICVDCLEANAVDHDAMHLLGMIAKNTGKFNEARQWMEKSLDNQPGQPHVWNNLGNVLKELGLIENAISAYERAVTLLPEYLEAWTNLGLALNAGGQHEEALTAFDRALTLSPGHSNTLNAKGQSLQALSRHEEAEKTYSEAVRSDPMSITALNNLGNSLRYRGKDIEAVEIFERASRLMPDAGHLRVALAGAQFSLGKFEEASAHLIDVIASEPDNVEAHRTLTKLLFSTDQGEKIPILYENTLAKFPDLDLLWEEYTEALWLLDEYDAGLEVAAKAREKCGDRPRLRLLTGRMMSSNGDPAGALDWLDSADGQLEQYFVIERARAYMRLGEYQTGAVDVHRAVQKMPDDYSVLAHLEPLWRLANDPRADWLMDYDRFVSPMEVPVPAGFRNHLEFNEVLAEFLTALHVTTAHPIDQTLRGGTQTYGHLFERTEPIIQSLKEVIRETIESFTATLKPDPEHPFLRHMGQSIWFRGSWSVRLRSGGFHVHHYHPEGWISSAYYVALPPTVADSATEDGRLRFGLPPVRVPTPVSAVKEVQPRVGTLALFPSYCWHGTVPFEDQYPRMTVAFDVARDYLAT